MRWQEAKDEVLLYRDKTLKDALAWVEAHPDDVETYEQEFLEASQQAERQRARTRRLYITGAVGLAAALVVMAVLAFWALRQSQIAVARQLAAQAEIILVDNTNLVRGMLLATESMRRFSSLEGNQAVHHGLEQAKLPSPLSEIKAGNAVWAVTFSPDGKWISTAGLSASKVWEVSTGRPLAQLNDSDLMGAVALSADGKRLATASGSVVRLWEVSTGRKVAAMTHKFDVNTLAFSPDGKWLATGSWNAAPRIWDVATGREGVQFGQVDIELKPVQVPTTTVAGSRAECDAAATAALLPQDFEHTLARTVTFSPDGKWLATIGNDNTARVWEVATGKEVTHMTHERAVLAVVFSPDGKRLATASRDNTARVWDIASGEQVVKVEHTCDVYDVTFSPDGKYMATASDDGTAGLWEVATGNIVHRLSHKRAVWVVRFSLDGRYVVTGSWDGTARMWEWVTGREVAQMTHARRGMVCSLQPGWTIAGNRRPGRDCQSVAGQLQRGNATYCA